MLGVCTLRVSSNIVGTLLPPLPFEVESRSGRAVRARGDAGVEGVAGAPPFVLPVSRGSASRVLCVACRRITEFYPTFRANEQYDEAGSIPMPRTQAGSSRPRNC